MNQKTEIYKMLLEDGDIQGLIDEIKKRIQEAQGMKGEMEESLEELKEKHIQAKKNLHEINDLILEVDTFSGIWKLLYKFLMRNHKNRLYKLKMNSMDILNTIEESKSKLNKMIPECDKEIKNLEELLLLAGEARGKKEMLITLYFRVFGKTS